MTFDRERVREPIGPAPNHDPGTSISTARSTCCWPGYCLTTATNLSIVAAIFVKPADSPAPPPLSCRCAPPESFGHGPGPDHINVIFFFLFRIYVIGAVFFLKKTEFWSRARSSGSVRVWPGRASPGPDVRVLSETRRDSDSLRRLSPRPREPGRLAGLMGTWDHTRCSHSALSA